MEEGEHILRSERVDAKAKNTLSSGSKAPGPLEEPNIHFAAPSGVGATNILEPEELPILS
ncbi:hypothetical protein A2U01_0076068, partial [Trifolium medium]|nr:hypothetical protein [Trifolium medium]